MMSTYLDIEGFLEAIDDEVAEGGHEGDEDRYDYRVPLDAAMLKLNGEPAIEGPVDERGLEGVLQLAG